MKRLLLLTIISLFALCLMAGVTTAFPGADGFGKFTTGGRGGKVYYVTSLADCTDANLVPGTLRWALRDGDDTPRTILFRVCGTIHLTSTLKMAHPNVTIAGQTAPGGGICIAGCKFYVCKSNVIIRHIRFRAGDIPDQSCPSLDVENVHNVILDHCSFTWSMEECLTMYDTDSTTVQYCIIGEGLYNSKNSKGARAYATQWGGEHSTMHHCLITNSHSRTPRFNGVRDEADLKNGKHNHDAQVDSEFANNVVFNWGKTNSVYGGENDTTKNRNADNIPIGYDYIYMLNNYFRPGPNTISHLSSPSKYLFVSPSSSRGYGSWLLRGNRVEGDCPLNADNYVGWSSTVPQLTAMRDSSGLTLQTAQEAYINVCANAGAQLPQLDEVDQRLLDEAAGRIEPIYFGDIDSTGKPDCGFGIINTPRDITLLTGDSLNYPSLAMTPGEQIPADTDADGIPDDWETEHGLDPLDPNDAASSSLSQLPNYTNLEYFLNRADGETAELLDPWTALPMIYTVGQSLPVKVFHHGQVLIIRHGRCYTVDGRKML